MTVRNFKDGVFIKFEVHREDKERFERCCDYLEMSMAAVLRHIVTSLWDDLEKEIAKEAAS